jgi:uncharacterized protein (TIGR00369 family)
VGQPIELGHLDAALNASPFHRFLGLTLVRAEHGRVEIALPVRDELFASAEDPYIHGGVIAALIDTAACFAVIAGVGRDVPTIDLRVDYFRPARREDLRAIATMIKSGRTLAVADVEVVGADRRVIAVGRGLFSTRE